MSDELRKYPILDGPSSLGGANVEPSLKTMLSNKKAYLVK